MKMRGKERGGDGKVRKGRGGEERDRTQINRYLRINTDKTETPIIITLNKYYQTIGKS